MTIPSLTSAAIFAGLSLGSWLMGSKGIFKDINDLDD